ncbi:hypothetical protein KCP78_24030 [Salmonella enterica subsp. enterica]|nr:hypothetical protein KCP78_24030 [Salmonella enterica subsp. enterica]
MKVKFASEPSVGRFTAASSVLSGHICVKRSTRKYRDTRGPLPDPVRVLKHVGLESSAPRREAEHGPAIRQSPLPQLTAAYGKRTVIGCGAFSA